MPHREITTWTKEDFEKHGLPTEFPSLDASKFSNATLSKDVPATIMGEPGLTLTYVEITTDAHNGMGYCNGLNVWPSSGVSGTLKFNSWTELLSQQNDMTIKVANNTLTITFMINSMAVASFSGTWPGTSVFNVQGRMQWN